MSQQIMLQAFGESYYLSLKNNYDYHFDHIFFYIYIYMHWFNFLFQREEQTKGDHIGSKHSL